MSDKYTFQITITNNETKKEYEQSFNTGFIEVIEREAIKLISEVKIDDNEL